MKKLILVIAAFLAASVAGAQTYDGNGNLLIRIERIQGSAPSATNPIPSRLSNGTTFIVPVLDTTLTARWPTGSTPADNESNAVTTTRVGSFTYVFDGSAWDRWTGLVNAAQSGTWTIDSITNPVAVTGTFFQATQPVSSIQFPAALVGGRLDVVVGAALPAGNNNIGDVDVVTLPSIPAGTNNIGDVDVLTLPALPAGTNNIGDVDVLTLPAIPAGNNNIGDVDVATIAAGNNNIGDVDVASLPAIPAGNNNIGDVDVATIAAGNNNIGDVDVASIAAGNNNIGDVDAIQSGTWTVRTQDGSGNALESSTTAPALSDRGLKVRVIDSTRTVTDNLDCTAASDAVTISGEGAGSILVTFPAGLGGACVITFEASADGTNFVSVPAIRYLSIGPSHFDEVVTVAAPSSHQYKFLQSGFRSYRVRVSTVGTGNGTATLDANTAPSIDLDTALYSTGTSTFDLTIPSNTLSIATKGASMIAFSFSSTIGASTVSFTHGGSAAECYQQGSASGSARTSITGALNSILFVCPLYGASTFVFTKDAGVGAGTPTLTFYVSMSGQVPDEKRYVTEWTNGSSPTTTTVGSPKELRTPEGQSAVTLDHPRRFHCAFSSTATTSTIIGGCIGAAATLAAPGAGVSYYIERLDWSSSIISTTANFMLIQYGTGGTCGSGTTAIYRGYISAAFMPNNPAPFIKPIKVAANNEVCFVHASAGTRLINITGYIAP